MFISPPLLNSASLWASNADELKSLYGCPHTGAITTRTTLINGFAHDDKTHKYLIFETSGVGETKDVNLHAASSLNTLGYSPYPLSFYIDVIRQIELLASKSASDRTKSVIFSVTGTPEEVSQCFDLLSASRPAKNTLMEVNLSCPNIPGKPPPAYSRPELDKYFAVLVACVERDGSIPLGVKIPPYTHAGQFSDFIGALAATCGRTSDTVRDGLCPIIFITAINTLGSSLVMSSPESSLLSAPAPAIGGSSGGLGGLAGASLHPLALGNVRTLRLMLDDSAQLRGVRIIGVGGVNSTATYHNMRAAGADFVGLATALGVKGVDIFADISTTA